MIWIQILTANNIPSLIAAVIIMVSAVVKIYAVPVVGRWMVEGKPRDILVEWILVGKPGGTVKVILIGVVGGLNFSWNRCILLFRHGR